MNTTVMSTQTDKKRLQDEFAALKHGCADVIKRMSSARQAAYENYANIYFWWNDARRVEGLVEGLTAQITSYKHTAVNHGINFSPLLVVLFNNTLSDQERNRTSRLLNALHKEVQARPDMYVHDGVSKLAGFIKKSGGFVAVVNTTFKTGELDKGPGSIEERAEKYEAAQAAELSNINDELAGYGINYVVVPRADAVKAKPIKDEEKVKVLTEAANEYWKKTGVKHAVTLGTAITMNGEGLCSALLKRVGDVIYIVDSSDDPKLIQAGQVTAYRKQYQVLPNSMRVVCESLRTQIEPWNTSTSREIVEVNPDPAMKGEDKMARTSLMYLSHTKQFVLSPARMTVGVVTTITPVKDVIEHVPYDVIMAPHSKAMAELRLIRESDFNLYEAASKDLISLMSDGKLLYSHRLDIKSKVKGLENMFLLFRSFDQQTAPKACQPVYSQEYDQGLDMHIELPLSTICSVTRDFAAPWTSDLGSKIKRLQYNHIGIKFTGSHIVISDNYVDGKFQSHEAISYADGMPEEQLYSNVFLTKDIMPILAALGSLPIEKSVLVKADANVLTFHFSTSAAHYTVAVPAFDIEKKQRMTAAFKSYQPSVRKLTDAEEKEQFIEQICTSNVADDYSDEGGIVLDEDTNLWRIESHV
jgi:hypothetical protein